MSDQMFLVISYQNICSLILSGERSQSKKGDVNGNCHNRSIMSKELKWSWEVIKSLLYTCPTCELLHQLWDHILNITSCSPWQSDIYTLHFEKSQSNSPARIFHLHRRSKGGLNSWIFVLAIEAHPEACLFQSLWTWTWPIPFGLVIILY